MVRNTNTQLRFLLSNRESLARMEAASFFVFNLFQDKKDIADSGTRAKRIGEANSSRRKEY
ncbi:hypothetical protein SAMN05444355_10712 [Flavobacterium frigoris]|uniref:Uncharacterized protein n=1 Tax=Flavobacterium frigoris TaxID=229204 RepID=A0A1H9LF77_FLAFI|nr:hypothetical protein SAMN05444355_10712 [Flavobacterium frigoris]